MRKKEDYYICNSCYVPVMQLRVNPLVYYCSNCDTHFKPIDLTTASELEKIIHEKEVKKCDQIK